MHSPSQDHGDISFFARAARAASIIPQIPGWVAAPVIHHHRHSSAQVDGDPDSRGRVDSAASRTDVDGSEDYDASLDNLECRRAVRTLPPWVHSLQENEDANEFDVHSTLLPQPQLLTETHHPHRNHMPSPKPKADPGRAYDHHRSREPVTMSAPIEVYASRWQAFAQASLFPRSIEGEVVDEDWLKENLPSLEEPWNPDGNQTERPRHESIWLFDNSRKVETFKTFHRMLLKNPFVPLVIRLIVLTFVTAALALGVDIYERSNTLNNSPNLRQSIHSSNNTAPDAICIQQASTYMAFVVDATAVIYLLYITWDEYFSPPLGLRSSKSKMRLLFLDLYFIVFSAANLSLAFNTVSDQQWSCQDGKTAFTTNSQNTQAAQTTCIRDDTLCDRQKSLCSVLLVALVAWLGTFSISTMRIVERMTS